MPTVHPCASNPYPESVVQPSLIAELKELKVPKEDIPPDYPYIIHRGNVRYRVPYFEFYGMGPPSNLDVGGGGDVYIDITPDQKALWGHTAQGWKRWLDIGDSSLGKTSGDRWVVSHPFFDYSLWISTRGGLHIAWIKHGSPVVRETRRWAVQQGLLNIPLQGVRKEEETAYREAAAMLAQLDILQGIPSFSGPVSSNRSATVSRSSSPTSPHVPTTDWESLDYTIPPGWSPPPEDDFKPQIHMPQHPCVANPHPISLVQPHITSSVKSFTVSTLPPYYPYHLEHLKGSYRVPYFQFTGSGAPTESLDVGTEGDVYLDSQAPAVWGKTATGWKQWLDAGETLRGAVWPDMDWIVKHPHFENYALWIGFGRKGDGAGQISWYRGTSSATNARTIARKKGLVKHIERKTAALLKLNLEEKRLADAANMLDYIISRQKPEDIPQTSSSKLPLKRKGSGVDGNAKKKTKSEIDGDFLIGPFTMRF
ncbi:hypothetical protein B0H17DRAFT_1204820 [Mycena rosella]|uniref:Uncharacterized protein n=1 Tax=Mycena rosella TaxID=1033263 RepID=A0AAD7GDC2_MYCRO|nr:hypothetical protein B0H17DRAFT_1204820 [Mycena rosella]